MITIHGYGFPSEIGNDAESAKLVKIQTIHGSPCTLISGNETQIKCLLELPQLVNNSTLAPIDGASVNSTVIESAIFPLIPQAPVISSFPIIV